MKEILGIFAAIAAVAGIAAAASKDEDKEINKQNEREKLELERQRLRMETEQQLQQHQLKLEQQRIEKQRLQQAKEREEYQRKLANAPKKAIYKPVPMICPRCDGKREIDESTNLVRCPYCDSVENLTIIRYEVDQEAFQKQLDEELLLKAEQEALKEKNGKLSIALLVVTSIFCLFLLLIPSKPIIASAFLIPLFITFCILLYFRFPNAGKKVWGALKYPLCCIAIFPLPLTAFFMNSERVKDKFNKAARISMSVGSWVLYVGIIAVCGIFYVKGFKQEMQASKDSTQSKPKTSQTAVQTTKEIANTTAAVVTQAAVIPTTTTTFVQVQANGWQEEKNQKLILGGIEWQLPYYLELSQEDSNDSVKVYYRTEEDTRKTARIWIGSEILNCSVTDYEKNKDKLQAIAAEKLDVTPQNSRDVSIAGLSGRLFDFTMQDDKGSKYIGAHIFAFNAESKTLVRIGLLEFASNRYSITDDYVKIVNEAILCTSDTTATESTAMSSTTETSAVSGTNTSEHSESTNASSANTESTSTTEPTTTQQEAQIYPQEEAFRSAVVAITNALATDVFTKDGSKHDTSKYHKYSDTSAFYMRILSNGTWTEKNTNTWHVENLEMKPDGYDTVYKQPINVSTIARVSLDVTYDGKNYIISNISGMYAIPGKENIGTNLSYLNSDSTSKTALTVTPTMIQKDR